MNMFSGQSSGLLHLWHVLLSGCLPPRMKAASLILINPRYACWVASMSGVHFGS